ncbi:hypothetical protein G4X40_00830 [Rhodococcus sp. D2-41]|nr:hypothetical protein [Rhodococcus sp. D2-41]
MQRGWRWLTSSEVTPGEAAGRISAYVYGNILILAALVPLTLSKSDTAGILIVVGTSFSTFLAHLFAESVGDQVRGSPEPLSRLLRDSLPILTSAVIPVLVLVTVWQGWLTPRLGHLLAELYLVVRLAGIPVVITRLRGTRPTGATLFGGLGLVVVALVIVVLKVAFAH